MMDTKKVMEFAASLDKKPEETKPTEETKATETQATVEETKEEPKGEETTTVVVEPAKQPEDKQEPVTETAKEDAPPATGAETKTDDKPAQQQQHSKQEQIDFAFKKEKAKRKALEAKYEQLQKKYEALQAKKPEDPKDQDAVIDYKVDLKDMQHEMERTQEAIQESQIREYDELNNARINACYPDPEEQRKFREVISVEGPKLLQKLEAADPENAVLGYLDDSELAPILTRLMIADTKYLDEVLSKRSPYGKYMAMQELERKVEFARNELAKKGKQDNQPAPKETKAKPAMPVVGSVTKSDSTKETKTTFDPNAILHALNAKNTYHSR